MRRGFGDCRVLVARRPAVLDNALPYRLSCSSRTLQVLEDRLGEPMLREMFRLGERSPVLCKTPLQILRRAYTKAHENDFVKRGYGDAWMPLPSWHPHANVNFFAYPRLAEPLSHSGEARHPYTTDHGAGLRPQGRCLQNLFPSRPRSDPSPFQNLRICSA